MADNGNWIGLKTVHKIAVYKSYTDWEMWLDVNGPANNWTLPATYHDTGCSDYNNIPLTWKCHKDLCRVDGFQSVDFTLNSDRAIEDKNLGLLSNEAKLHWNLAASLSYFVQA